MLDKIILTFTLSILFFSLASASSYTIQFNQVDNKVLVEHFISFDSPSEFSIPLPEDFYSLSCTPECSDSLNQLLTGKNIELSYLTKSLLEKSSQGYYFIEPVKFNNHFDSVSIKLSLKEGYFSNLENVFPKPSGLETNGRQISLIWNLTDVSPGDDLPIFVSIERESSSSFWIILSISALVILALIFAFFRKKPAIFSKTKSSPENYLLDSEKAIISSLKEADRGELWQRQIQLKTGFSKAKLSRLIRNLESRNLVEKIPFGNTNKVRLK